MSEIRLDVKIDGRTYPLVTKESKESIEEIAKFVDKKIREVKSDKLTFDRQLILACLNIADEYIKLEKNHDNFLEANQEAIEKYPTIRDEFNSFKEEYAPYKLSVEEKTDEIKKLKDILKDRDEEILRLTEASEDIASLRATIKKLSEQAMDLAKENEMLKGKL